MVGHSILIAKFSLCWHFSPEKHGSSKTVPLKVGEVGRAIPPLVYLRASQSAQNQKRSISRDEKADKHPLRTTKAFPGCAEVQLEKQNLSSN